MSTSDVGRQIEPSAFVEDADIREISATRTVDGSYANGYGNSKWAGEVLLREAHDLCGLPVAVFRSGMIMADPDLCGSAQRVGHGDPDGAQHCGHRCGAGVVLSA